MSDVMIAEVNIELIERLVNLQLLEVADNDILRALVLTEDELRDLREHTEFKRVLSVKVLEEVESRALVDQGWDGVEQLGIKTVIDSLQWAKDPEFALKAAAVANKAARRHRGQGPTIQGQVGGRTVIHLERRFIQKVQDQFTGVTKVTEQREVLEIPQKDVNMLNPAKVEGLLVDKLKLPKSFGDGENVENDEMDVEQQLGRLF